MGRWTWANTNPHPKKPLDKLQKVAVTIGKHNRNPESTLGHASPIKEKATQKTLPKASSVLASVFDSLASSSATRCASFETVRPRLASSRFTSCVRLLSSLLKGLTFVLSHFNKNLYLYIALGLWSSLDPFRLLPHPFQRFKNESFPDWEVLLVGSLFPLSSANLLEAFTASFTLLSITWAGVGDYPPADFRNAACSNPIPRASSAWPAAWHVFSFFASACGVRVVSSWPLATLAIGTLASCGRGRLRKVAALGDLCSFYRRLSSLSS